jgi:hypothetical protein
MKRNFKSVIVNNITKENRKQNVSYLLRQAIAYVKRQLHQWNPWLWLRTGTKMR